MEIYCEYFFLENLIADGAIVALTFKIWRKKIAPARFIIGVVLMALYSFSIFLPSSAVLYNWALKMIVSLLIVKILFAETGMKEFLQIYLTFIGISMALGGAVSFIIYFLNIGGMSSFGIVYVGPESYSILIACIAAAYFFIRVFISLLAEKRKKEAVIAEVEIAIGERIMEYKGLVDTGNALRDPIDNIPVMLGEVEALRPLIAENYENIKIRIIPYSALGTKTGTLIGIKIDMVKLKYGGEEYHSGPVVLAIYDGSFGLNEGCRIILHPDMMKKEAV